MSLAFALDLPLVLACVINYNCKLFHSIYLAFTLALPLACVINKNCKWYHNLEYHLLMMLAASFMIVICL